MTCPHCQQEVTLEHLHGSPECMKAVQSLCGLYHLANRKTVTRAGGRSVEMVPGPRCGKPVTKTQSREGHGCQEIIKA
jgi:hypothetical protein